MTGSTWRSGGAPVTAHATSATVEVGATCTPNVGESPGGDVAVGTVVGDYEIVEKIGAGGFGAIYRAIHPVIGRVAAIKVLHSRFASDPVVAARFLDEARAVNRIRHRNIIDVYSFGRMPDERLFYVMNFLAGESLDAHLVRGPMAIPDALSVLRAISRALDAAHDAGIVHRDLKPANVFLARDGDGRTEPKLLDFGVAKLVAVEDEFGARKTDAGAPIGTPAYMSPEQCRGAPVDARADIYALGVVAFELLTGRCPFDGGTFFDVLNAHVHRLPPRASSVSARVPPVLDGPLLEMLAKNPEQRPARASTAIERLLSAAKSAGIEPTSSTAGLRLVTDRPPAAAPPTDSLVATGVRSLRQTLSKPSRSAWTVWGALTLAGVGAVAGLVWRASPSPTPAASSHEETRIEVPADTSSAPTPSVIPSATTVKLRLSLDPKNAEVLVNGEPIVVDAGGIDVPIGSAVLTLDVRAPAHAAERLSVVPDRDQTVRVRLRPQVRSPVPSHPKIHKALEDPF